MCQRPSAVSAHLLVSDYAGRARLTFYPPRLRQPSHTHDAAHLSILLAGSLKERSARQECEGAGGAFHLRPTGAHHQVEFGPHGALILAIELSAHTRTTSQAGWQNLVRTSVHHALLQHLLQDMRVQVQDIDELIEDLIAMLAAEHLVGKPPRWLRQAHAQLLEQPASSAIHALAAAAGVHRAHFTRCFVHWFGAPPSVFRRNAMAAAAFSRAMHGEPLVQAAHAEGFADQSHFGRAFRRLLGCAPRQVLRLR